MTGRMLLQFVEKTGIPFVTTQLGKGVIDETNPKFLGCAALSANDFVHKAIEAADLIVNVGHDVIEKPPFFMKNGGTEVIHVSTRSAEVDPVYFPQIEVIGDIANAIWQMKEDIVPSGRWNFDKMMKARGGRGRAQRQARRGLPLPGHALLPGQGGARRRCRRTASSASTTASTRSGSRAIIRRASRTRCCSTMRWRRWARACRRAMASAMVYPDRKVMAICGDGGFMMNSQEMETAVRLGLNITVLILRDDSYGMIRWKQANMGFKDWGLTFGNPDFVKYAEAYGANGHRVDSADDLPRAAQAHARHARRPPDRLPGRLCRQRPDPEQRDQGVEREAMIGATDAILRRFETPDEVRNFPKGKFELVRIGGMTIGRATYQPGWKWSADVGAAMGVARCDVEHVGLVVSGCATAAMEDGTVHEMRAGDLFYIRRAAGHDSWVVGDEPYVSLHFMGADRLCGQGSRVMVKLKDVYPLYLEQQGGAAEHRPRGHRQVHRRGRVPLRPGRCGDDQCGHPGRGRGGRADGADGEL